MSGFDEDSGSESATNSGFRFLGATYLEVHGRHALSDEGHSLETTTALQDVFPTLVLMIPFDGA